MWIDTALITISYDITPDAYLFSEKIDEVAASGIILARIWEDSNIICIDNLGQEFLDSVSSDDELEIKYDGTVVVLDKNNQW